MSRLWRAPSLASDGGGAAGAVRRDGRHRIFSRKLPKRSVGPAQLRKNAVRAQHIKARSITAAKLAQGTLASLRSPVGAPAPAPAAAAAASPGEGTSPDDRVASPTRRASPTGPCWPTARPQQTAPRRRTRRRSLTRRSRPTTPPRSAARRRASSSPVTRCGGFPRSRSAKARRRC